MATEETGKDLYSGRSRYELRLIVRRSGVSGNSSKYEWWLRAHNLDGSSLTWDGTSAPWKVSVEGSSYSGSKALDFRGGQAYIELGHGETGYKAHNSAGALEVSYSASHTSAGIFGSASLSGSFPSTPLVSVPGKAPMMNVVSTTPTTIAYTSSAPSNGGASFTRSQHQATPSGTGWDTPDHSNLYTEPDNNSSYSFTGLSSSKKYALRVRYENGVGWGEWSDTVYATTLPGDKPVVVVVPSASGTSATVTLTPPSGVSGVDFYTLNRRVQGSSSTTTVKVTGSTYTANGLTPGTVYEWWATATIGTYTTPSSLVVAVPQPDPNAGGGTYFDGDTPDVGNLAYNWLGTAHKSKSTATLPEPQGWQTYAQGATVSGGAGIVVRVVGAAPLPGTRLNNAAATHAAQVQFSAPTVSSGFRSGLDAKSPVNEIVTYVGSMYVLVAARQQRLRARISWYTAGGGFIAASVGDAQIVPAGAWTRLSVTAESPAGAVLAAVMVTDVTGSGWALWKAGDTLTMDAAMLVVGSIVPYFDGSFVDDGEHAYDWSGTANASTSVRSTHYVAPPDPLADPDCDPIPAPPRPPVILDECVEEVPSWRRYWYEIPAAEVSDWLAELPTIILTSGDLSASQIRIRIYPNPFGYATDEIDVENFCSEQIISYMPAQTTLTLDGPIRRVFAEVQGQPALPADHLLYGTGGIPASWPELSCGMAHLMSVDYPLPSPTNNVQTRLLLTRRT